MDCSIDQFSRQAFKLNKPMPELLLSKICYSILNALDYMESKETMHRDVKPSNFLINRKGEIKLCDFGISGITIDSYCRTYRGCEIYMSVR